VFGGRQQVSSGSVGGFLGTAGLMASVAVTEDLLFRGVVFRIMTGGVSFQRNFSCRLT
jgi:hypothetical protein